MSPNMHNRKVGNFGERIAAQYLLEKGYTIVKRNFRYGRGEIDLIVRDGETLVFVEVKSRKHGGYGPPEARVSRRKQRQLGKLAQAYLLRLDEPVDCRFDVLAVELAGDEPEVRHIEDAFWLH